VIKSDPEDIFLSLTTHSDPVSALKAPTFGLLSAKIHIIIQYEASYGFKNGKLQKYCCMVKQTRV